MQHKKSLSISYEQKKIREGFNFVIGCDEVGRGCLAGPVVAAAVVLDFSKIKDKGLRIKDIQDSKLLTQERREKVAPLIQSSAVGWGIGIVNEKVIDKINIHHASLLAMRKAVENLLKSVACESNLSLRGVKGFKLATKQSGSAAAIPEFLSASEKISGIQKVAQRIDPGSWSRMTQDTTRLPRLSDAFKTCNDRKKYFVAVDGKFIIPEFHLKQEAVVNGDAKIISIAAASIIAKVFRDKLVGKLHKKYPEYNFPQHKGYATLHHRNAIKKFGLLPVHRLSFCGKYK